MINSPHLYPLYYIFCIVHCSLRPIVFCKQNASWRWFSLANCKSLLPPQKSQKFLFTEISSQTRDLASTLQYCASFVFWGSLIFWAKLLSVFFNTLYSSELWYSALLKLCILLWSVFFNVLYSSILVYFNPLYSPRICRNYQYSRTKMWRQKFWCAKKIDFWKDSAPVSLLSNVRPEFF